jgi:hypothetical protein
MWLTKRAPNSNACQYPGWEDPGDLRVFVLKQRREELDRVSKRPITLEHPANINIKKA